jgi:hypothetical protein
LILKDTNNNKPQGDPKYVPTDLHVEVTAVREGATYQPPWPHRSLPAAFRLLGLRLYADGFELHRQMFGHLAAKGRRSIRAASRAL